MKKRFLFGLFVLLFLVGCDYAPRQDSTFTKGQTGRIEIVSSQTFYQDGHERAILVLRDKQTDKEYLAVIGAGVTEMDYAEETHPVLPAPK